MMDTQKILVPVVGTETDDEAMRLACGLAKKNKGKIWAVFVIALKRDLPLEAEVEPEIEEEAEVDDPAYADHPTPSSFAEAMDDKRFLMTGATADKRLEEEEEEYSFDFDDDEPEEDDDEYTSPW